MAASSTSASHTLRGRWSLTDEWASRRGARCVTAAILHPELEFTIGSRVLGKDEYATALRRLTLIMRRNDVRRVFAEGNEACVVYDFVTDTPVGPVASVELLGLEDGLIRTGLLVFEREHWPEVMAELERRAGAARSL
ncbi:MAG TPA: hypothetical protein VE777_11210 [Gaiellales bacterium]|nr:hypothetical protein [Gaiellales bacterium]